MLPTEFSSSHTTSMSSLTGGGGESSQAGCGSGRYLASSMTLFINNFYRLIEFNNKMEQLRIVSACQHKFTPDRKCRKCGIYQHCRPATKSTQYAYPLHFAPKRYQGSLRESAHSVIEGRQIKRSTWEQLNALCKKFQFSNETLALSLYIYQKTRGEHPCQKFWSSAALMVAAKAVELDRNVPYFNRYQRHADRTFSQLEYEEAERNLFEYMGFKVHYSTFVTFLDFYLTCGVVMEEEVGECPEKVIDVEDEVKSQTYNLLKKGNFPRQEPQITALAIIKQARRKNCLEGWNAELQNLTGRKQAEIPSIDTDFMALRQLNGNRLSNCYIKGASKHYEHILKSCQKVKLPKYASIRKSSVKENSTQSGASTHRSSGSYLLLKHRF